MGRIARHSEADRATASYSQFIPWPDLDEDVAKAVCSVADAAKADAIIVPTLSGRTARQMARYRPATEIIAPVPRVEVRRRLALIWGVRPVPLKESLSPGDDRIDAAVRASFVAGEVCVGQRVVVV